MAEQLRKPYEGKLLFYLRISVLSGAVFPAAPSREVTNESDLKKEQTNAINRTMRAREIIDWSSKQDLASVRGREKLRRRSKFERKRRI